MLTLSSKNYCEVATNFFRNFFSNDDFNLIILNQHTASKKFCSLGLQQSHINTVSWQHQFG